MNFVCRVSQKNTKNGDFLLFSKLLEILILKHISRVPPCEASRPDDSENVVVFGIFLYDFTLFGIDIQYTPEYVHFILTSFYHFQLGPTLGLLLSQ